VKGDHALEIFDTPKSLSVISQEKEVVLRGCIQGPRAKVINNISNNGAGDLNGIMNYIKNHHQ
jgi:hypothetical protein